MVSFTFVDNKYIITMETFKRLNRNPVVQGHTDWYYLVQKYLQLIIIAILTYSKNITHCQVFYIQLVEREAFFESTIGLANGALMNNAARGSLYSEPWKYASAAAGWLVPRRLLFLCGVAPTGRDVRVRICDPRLLICLKLRPMMLNALSF